MLVTISQSFAGSFFLKTDTSRQKTKVAIKEFNEIWHTCWAMGETEKPELYISRTSGHQPARS
jgi:hypothetical protein